jgi:hypothetical protein
MVPSKILISYKSKGQVDEEIRVLKNNFGNLQYTYFFPNHAIGCEGLILPKESVNEEVREKIKRHTIDRLFSNVPQSYSIEEEVITRTSSVHIWKKEFESLIDEEIKQNDKYFHEMFSAFFEHYLWKFNTLFSFFIPENYQCLAKEKLAFLGEILEEINLKDVLPERFLNIGISIPKHMENYTGTDNLNECLVKAYEIKPDPKKK